jgi:hypothetical protein
MVKLTEAKEEFLTYLLTHNSSTPLTYAMNQQQIFDDLRSLPENKFCMECGDKVQFPSLFS